MLSSRLFLLLPLLCLLGCEDRSASNAKSLASNSAEKLHELLPNLQAYELESCDFSMHSWTKPRQMVPAPSDTWNWLVGSARMTADAAPALRADFTWQPVATVDLPDDLKEILPPGEAWLVSPECNDSFLDNRSYKHGYAVLSESEDPSVFYFLVQDDEHPIE